MEYLNLVKGLFTDNWATITVFVLPFILPNRYVESIFYGIGRFFSKALRQRVGRGGEKVETYFQGTLDAVVRGLHAGLDEDDLKGSDNERDEH